MNTALTLPLLSLTSYLLGALPFSILLLRFHGMIDPRTYGSGNIGATNVGRQKKSLGLAVFFLDASKVYSALALARYCGLPEHFYSLLWFIVVFGQTRSLFLGWTGGKGVSCFIAGILCLYPSWFFPLAIPSLACVFLTQRVWVGSITAVSLFGMLSCLSLSPSLACIHLVLSLWIILLHSKNMRGDKIFSDYWSGLFKVFTR